MKIPRTRIVCTAVLGMAMLIPAAAAEMAGGTAAPVRILLGTLAPSRSSYHNALLEMRDAWKNASGGTVQVILYPDGRQGSEADMVNKMRSGNLTAGLLTAVGLSDIDPSASCLQLIPMAFRSWDEVDHVREALRPKLEKYLLDKGFVVLFWGDAGWVHFYSKEPVLHPSDLKPMKVFVWSGNTFQVELMKAMGYQPREMETASVVPNLQTGLIDAAPLATVFALAGQIDRVAPNMLDLNWAPISGAAVIRKDVWDAIPAETRAAMAKAAATAGEKIRSAGREEDAGAIKAMQKRGLKVHSVPPEVEQEWRSLAESVYPKIRGKMVPADLFDEVLRLRNEFRHMEKTDK